MTTTLEARAALAGSRREPARAWLAIYGVFGALLTAAAVTLTEMSSHLVHPDEAAFLLLNLVGGTFAVGLYWSARRPASSFGPLLYALALCYAGASLEGASTPALHSVGVLFEIPAFLLSTYLVLAFPLGRVRRLERGLLLAIGLVIMLAFVPYVLFSESIQGYTPFLRCGAACPDNALLLADQPSLADLFERLIRVLFVFVGLATVFGLAYRIRVVKRPERRARQPVLLWTIAWAIAFFLYALLRLSTSVDADATTAAGWVLSLTRATLSYSFLVSALMATLFAATALKQMVKGFGTHPSPNRIRDVLADALDDSELAVAFWIPGSDVYVDSNRQILKPPAPGTDRVMTEVGSDAQRVALVHHEALLADPELLVAAGTASLLALETGRLEQELERSSTELRASRLRTTTAADSERRRIERDLHDSAQQQLVAVRMRLSLAEELIDKGDPELMAVLRELGDELDVALADLRAVAHGIYPPLLAQSGLPMALEQVGRRSGLPVRIDHDGVGRYPEEIETAVYFSCVEALQNAAKHAGPGVAVDIRLWEQEGSLHFFVEDDGSGFSDSARGARGTGLVNMADRIGSVGGTIDVTSTPSNGTMVSGHVPLTGGDGSEPR